MTAGRIHPLSYTINLNDIKDTPMKIVETVYIIGGLYGNWAALSHILKYKLIEEIEMKSNVTLLFNGDFNWLNVTNETFELINQTVLQHIALKGNIESELAAPTPNVGCGCAYPDSVEDEIVDRSNSMIQRLQQISSHFPLITNQLLQLPSFINLKIGSIKVTALHGDPESIAGWGLGIDAMPPIGQTNSKISEWFNYTGTKVFACSHTCIPFMQNFNQNLVVNNGAAGMPNFSDNLAGTITRISIHKTSLPILYGTKLSDCYIDALPIEWDYHWNDWFIKHWPDGSTGNISYANRFNFGTHFKLKQAIRLDQCLSMRT